MKLMTKQLEKRFAKVGPWGITDAPTMTDFKKNEPDPVIIAHYFHPFSNWDWYAVEYDPEKRLFFGLVSGHEVELGYFSLDELESVKVRGLGIERDLYWTEKPLSEVKRKALERRRA